MGQVQAAHLPERVLNTQGLQRTDRSRRGEEPTTLPWSVLVRLSCFCDRSFKIGKNHVTALQQRRNRRYGGGRGNADIRPNHRLTGQDDSECGRLRPYSPSNGEYNDEEG